MDNISRMQKPSSGDMRSAVEHSAKERYCRVSTQTIVITETRKKKGSAMEETQSHDPRGRKARPEQRLQYNFVSGNLHRSPCSKWQVRQKLHDREDLPKFQPIDDPHRPSSEGKHLQLQTNETSRCSINTRSCHTQWPISLLASKTFGGKCQGFTIGRKALFVVQIKCCKGIDNQCPCPSCVHESRYWNVDLVRADAANQFPFSNQFLTIDLICFTSKEGSPLAGNTA